MSIFNKILAVGILSTTAMTLFSYGLSYLTKKRFREPQLLNELISQFPKNSLHLCREHILGWTIHLFIGFFFVASFEVLSRFDLMDDSIESGILYGFLSGLVGVAGWWLSLHLHPNPPKLNRAQYFIHLIPAHVVFGITMVQLL